MSTCMKPSHSRAMNALRTNENCCADRSTRSAMHLRCAHNFGLAFVRISHDETMKTGEQSLMCFLSVSDVFNCVSECPCLSASLDTLDEKDSLRRYQQLETP